MDSPMADPIRILLVESDGIDSSRLVDELSDATISAVPTVTAVRDRLADGSVDCLVVGSPLTADGDVGSVLETVETDSPTVPIVCFAEPDELAAAESSIEYVAPSRPGSTAILAARIEAVVANRRASTLETIAQRTADVATDGVALVSRTGHVTDLFGDFAETVGCDHDDLFGCPIASIYDSDSESELESLEAVYTGDRERWSGKLVALATDESVEREYTAISVAGDRTAVVVHTVPGPSDRETVLTDHLIFESMMERLPISLYAKDEQARHIRASNDQVDPPIETPDGERLTDPEQFLGKTDHDLFASNLSNDSYADDRHVIETGEPIVDKVERYEPADGPDRWTTTSKVPWTDSDGTIRGLVGATLDITAEIEHERESERQRQRLEEFASVVAHDLRNPLNVARGYLDLTRQTDDTAHLADVDDSLERMQRLIDDVLLLARQGNAALTVSPISLQPVLEEAWSHVSTGDATLHLADVEDLRLEADRGRLLQLVENVFRNAVEHGGETAIVTVTVEPLTDDDGRGTTVGFALEDDGPGIDPDDRETVFESGYTTSEEGTGFGLAIVEQIVEAHDWEIDVGEGTNSGARFEIRGVDVVDR
ncbi:ATP-binding protein [Natronoglomus mannanivorans]|uniref:histidine kinase n=1 Tax=Natronoglomus mannanivorans TaxID=2979990 RepID=A0AAP3E189_9EURY|nr:ATP-binding protein [Halobacteria archaeon AArc-xg1-1]